MLRPYSGCDMARERKTLKARIDGPSVTRVHSPIGRFTMLQIVKKVSKKVNHPTQVKDGKPVQVKREATITANFVDPKNEAWYEDALVLCGGDSSLVAKAFNQGIWRVIQQWETNKLGSADDVSKGLERAINGLVQTGLYTPEAARTLIMSNPATAESFKNQKFEQFVTVAIEDFAAYTTETDDKGVKSCRYPDVTDVGEAEAEAEAEEKTA